MRVEVISVGDFEEEEIRQVFRIPRESKLPEKGSLSGPRDKD